MAYRVQGLDPASFRHLFGQPDAVLAAQGVRRCLVDACPGFPDRIAVRDLEVGETALLLNFEHQPAPTPYRASHAIFIGEQSERPLDLVGALPDAILRRPISLRAFSAAGEMVDACLAPGTELEPPILTMLERRDVAYLHAHYAVRGCYAARIVRA
ncbi:DUF1203 domain-containing protein [Novosphingobium sp.]|uniref:DUF1203 domain-containing protein n=1 Tax=Novosphingobium sp. TaxID=1874826 RepID=UPI002619B999|nr:DUF1203 domain-containing protein [Novosphingobium sp.]